MALEQLRAAKIMERLGISHLSGESYRYLSGGQQQRVLLARALCATEKMLLLDEPVAGLDPAATAEMYDMIGKLDKEEGITVIMISHDIIEQVAILFTTLRRDMRVSNPRIAVLALNPAVDTDAPIVAGLVGHGASLNEP